MPAILLVCTGNRSRSPIACALLRHLVAQKSVASAWRIESAGTWAIENKSATAQAQAVMRERGLDIHAHRSRCVSGELLRTFDLILTMESGQKEALQFEFPHVASRIYLLSEMAGRAVDIADPAGGALTEYRLLTADIWHWLVVGYDRIVDLARSASVLRGSEGSTGRATGTPV